MENSENVKQQSNLVKEIFYRIKENIALILIIVILSGCAGVVYHKLQKPVYKASEMVNYMAYYEDDGDTENVKGAIDLMSVYVDTMVDFCASGVVLDRAEYYYVEYLNSGNEIDTFINDVKNGKYNDYDPALVEQRKHFNVDTVSSSLLTHDDSALEESYIFTLSVTSGDPVVAREKLRVFALAADQESRDFFNGVKSYVFELVKDTEGVKVTTESSMVKDVSMAVVLGFILAALIVYIKSLLDSTMKDKEELEYLTGVDLLAYIEKQEDYDAGK